MIKEKEKQGESEEKSEKSTTLTTSTTDTDTEKISKNDFVELEFTGYADGKVFDTTSEEVARQENLFDKNTKFKAMAVSVGQGQLLAGLDDALIGKNIGSSFEITLQPEQAFGKRDPRLVKIAPLSVFRDKQLNPYPGLVVNFGGLIATIRSVNGGRVTLDFNNPLASKTIVYKVNIKRKLQDLDEKLKAFVEYYLQTDKFKLNDNKIFLEPSFLKACPPEALTTFLTKCKETLQLELEIAEINEKKKEEKDSEEKSQKKSQKTD